MFAADLQNWGLEGRQREVIKRQHNAAYLAGLRAQIESQKNRKRRDKFEPTAVEPTRMPARNPADYPRGLPDDFAPPPPAQYGARGAVAVVGLH